MPRCLMAFSLSTFSARPCLVENTPWSNEVQPFTLNPTFEPPGTMAAPRHLEREHITAMVTVSTAVRGLAFIKSRG
jgi:hypothetical protein